MDGKLTIKQEQVTVPATVYEFDEAGGHYRLEVYAPAIEYGCEMAYAYRLTRNGKPHDLCPTGIFSHLGCTEKETGHAIELFVEDTHEYFMGIAVDHTAKEAFFIRPEYIDSKALDLDAWPLAGR